MISHIHTRVADYFNASGVDAAVAYGWAEHGKQINQGTGGASRIVFVPGDKAGKAGTLGPPIRTTGNPRPLATWYAYLSVFVWGVDKANPRNDAAQVCATQLLFERLFRAVHATYPGYYRFGDPAWVIPPIEYAFGRELSVSLTLNVPIQDAEYPIATPTPVLTKVVIPPT